MKPLKSLTDNSIKYSSYDCSSSVQGY